MPFSEAGCVSARAPPTKRTHSAFKYYRCAVQRPISGGPRMRTRMYTDPRTWQIMTKRQTGNPIQTGRNTRLPVTTTTRRQTAAAGGARLPALGPWVTGDGAVEDRPHPRLLRPPPASPRSTSTCTASAACSKSAPVKNAARSAKGNSSTLAGVVGVDSRWVPRARTRRATPAMMCTVHARCRETRKSTR